MPWLWLAWFGAALLTFAVIETIAVRTGRKTLSQCVYDLSRAWPPLPFVIGVVVGALAAHWWWQWVPG